MTRPTLNTMESINNDLLHMDGVLDELQVDDTELTFTEAAQIEIMKTAVKFLHDNFNIIASLLR